MDNKFYFLALNRMRGVGPRAVAHIFEHWPHLADAFQLSSAQLQEVGVSSHVAHAMRTLDTRGVDADLRWEEQANHTLLTWEHPAYPPLLKEIYDPPVVLYARGDLACLQQPTLAMVGTRKPSITGSETAYRFSFELAQHHVTVVSGLALGIDARAHQGCLDAERATVAVMGTGIDCIYPYRHTALAEKIQQKGLLLSEFSLNTPPIAGHFPRRNRIISGLSLSTLVIEAAIKSGSLITARYAMEQNRDVLAIPGSIHNPAAKGCHYLLQQGARLVESTKDILDALNMQTLVCDSMKQQQTLASEKEDLVKCIGFEMTTVDQILRRSGLSLDMLMCELAELELQGLIVPASGGYMRG